MKKKFTKLTAVILAAISALGITAYAATNSRNIDIFFRNIKIMIDGAEYIAKDVNGNVVEPFIYNGTTYLPVRAVANAFGKDVVWDGENATVYLGKKGQNEPDEYLSRLQYNNYIAKYKTDAWMRVINGNIEDWNGNTYTSGLLFYNWQRFSHDDLGEKYHNANFVVSYPLNCQYETLTGKIVLPKSVNITTNSIKDCGTAETDVIIYGDGEQLYKAVGVTNSQPFKFDIDVSGIAQLDIYVILKAKYDKYYVALTDLALYE